MLLRVGQNVRVIERGDAGADGGRGVRAAGGGGERRVRYPRFGMMQPEHTRQPEPAESTPAALTVPEAIARYDQLARTYGIWERVFESTSLRRALELASVSDGERVLEVACGAGAVLGQLMRRNPGGYTVGLDASEEMVRRARRQVAALSGPRGGLLIADCRALPFPDETFDVVLATYLLDLLSLADMRRTMTAMRRVLRPGGRLVSVSMTHDGLLMRLWGWLYPRAPRLLGGCRSVAARPLMVEAGFASIDREVISQWGFPSEVVVGRMAAG